MKVLTQNGYPILASEDSGKLVGKMDELFDRIMDDPNIEILDARSSITNGFPSKLVSYEHKKFKYTKDDRFTIMDIEVI